MIEKISWEKVNQVPIPLLSPAYKSNGFVFTSGSIGADPVTGVIIPDIAKQTERAIINLESVLKNSGSSLNKVIKVLLYITDEEHSSVVNEIYGKYFVHQPARSCIIVGFANKDIKVEIEAVAECELNVVLTDKKNVLVIGMGGVGSIVAYGIDYVGKSDLSIVVRGEYEKIFQEGFEIHSYDYGHIKGWKPQNIFRTIEDAAKSGKEFDFIVIATKNLPDVVKLEDIVEPLMTSKRVTIVLMQNGFDLAKPFHDKYPENIILSGVSHIGSTKSNGVIYQNRKDRSLIGYFDNPSISKDLQEEKAQEFISIYKNSKNDPQYTPDTKWARYRKLVYNASLNTVCALTGVDTGRLTLSGGLESVSIPAMREVISIAKADGVYLPEDSINTACHADDGQYYEPSMSTDVKNGNPIESQVILGNLISRARDLKIETPVLSVLYNLLSIVQFKLKENQGRIVVPQKRQENNKKYN